MTGLSYGGSEPSTHNSVLAFGDHDSTARRKSRESSSAKKTKANNKQARQRERSMSTPIAGAAVSLARTRSTGSSATAVSEVENPFLKPVPEDGVEAGGFAGLGKAGWDLWGPRDAHVLDGTQVRGDCCTVSSSSSSFWCVRSDSDAEGRTGCNGVLCEHNEGLDPNSGLGAAYG